MEEPRDVEVNFGSTVYFHCKAEGDPTPEIVWLHNRSAAAPSPSVTFQKVNMHNGIMMMK